MTVDPEGVPVFVCDQRGRFHDAAGRPVLELRFPCRLTSMFAPNATGFFNGGNRGLRNFFRAHFMGLGFTDADLKAATEKFALSYSVK